MAVPARRPAGFTETDAAGGSEIPAIPGIPVIPETAGVPGTPVTPVPPAISAMTDAPAIPEIPVTPETPATLSSGEALPHSLPKSPGFLEHFSLPHALGSEELLLLGLMYLTSQKPGDDLWIYLLVLLFCG